MLDKGRKQASWTQKCRFIVWVQRCRTPSTHTCLISLEWRTVSESFQQKRWVYSDEPLAAATINLTKEEQQETDEQQAVIKLPWRSSSDSFQIQGIIILCRMWRFIYSNQKQHSATVSIRKSCSLIPAGVSTLQDQDVIWKLIWALKKQWYKSDWLILLTELPVSAPWRSVWAVQANCSLALLVLASRGQCRLQELKPHINTRVLHHCLTASKLVWTMEGKSHLHVHSRFVTLETETHLQEEMKPSVTWHLSIWRQVIYTSKHPSDRPATSDSVVTKGFERQRELCTKLHLTLTHSNIHILLQKTFIKEHQGHFVSTGPRL